MTILIFLLLGASVALASDVYLEEKRIATPRHALSS